MTKSGRDPDNNIRVGRVAPSRGAVTRRLGDSAKISDSETRRLGDLGLTRAVTRPQGSVPQDHMRSHCSCALH